MSDDTVSSAEDTAKDAIVKRGQAAMNPPALTPLRPPAKRAMSVSVPPIIAQPRPMPPSPPQPLPTPAARGVVPYATNVERPKTPHALELERQGEINRLRPGQTICDICGNTKRVNIVKDKQGNVVGFSPCPRCVEL